MYFSRDTWQGTPYWFTTSTTAFIMGLGPHTYTQSYCPVARSPGSTAFTVPFTP